MSMRIGNQTDGTAISSTQSGAAQSVAQDARLASSAANDSDGDQVSLSSATHLLASAKASIPADKQAKIANLTSAVRSGTYRVDSRETSRNLIQAHLEN